MIKSHLRYLLSLLRPVRDFDLTAVIDDYTYEARVDGLNTPSGRVVIETITENKRYVLVRYLSTGLKEFGEGDAHVCHLALDRTRFDDEVSRTLS